MGQFYHSNFNAMNAATSLPPAPQTERQLVTFSMEIEGRRVVVENVPARVDSLTGERFFDLATVDKIRLLISQQAPVRFEQTPVFAFAA